MLSVEELLSDLTPEQQTAVTTTEGPLLIIAAAGSGKTRVLTRRVAYLIAQGIPPGAICAITFTNKAAGEMKDRVGKLMGRHLRDFGRLEDRQPNISTFHSLCIRILRHYGPRIGLPGLTIFDTSDQLRVVKEALKLLDMDAKNFTPNTILGTISGAKNKLQNAQQFASAASDFYQKQVARVYLKYQSMLEAQGAMDFDDLLLRTVRAFKEHPDVLSELQDRFQYIMVDEYQDTNKAQYVLTAALAIKHRNLCVVGDPDQSIYAWRGADIQNILDFERDYTDAKVVMLEMNYRSTKTILAVADQLIKNNARRRDKRLLTPNPDGEKVKVVVCQDEHDEADYVTQQIKAANKEGMIWSKMAIFYRMNSLSRVMEDALRRSNIPYVMARGVEFYNRKEIKDVISYLKAIANPLDEISLDRIVNTPPRGIGDTTLDKIRAYSLSRGISLFSGMEEVERIDGLSARAKNATRALVGQLTHWRGMARLSGAFANPPAPATDSDGPELTDADIPESEGEEDFTAYLDQGSAPISQPPTIPPAKPTAPPQPAFDPNDMFAAFAPPETHATVTESKPSPLPPAPTPPAPPILPEGKGPLQHLMEVVIKQSGLEALYAKESKSAAAVESGEGPLSNVNELISSAAEFDQDNPEGTLEDYLTQVALVADTDALKADVEGGGGGAVTMMTLHAAKGLEFPFVAMIGLEEGLLPHSRARDNVDELEEERRLAFVGITRAQEKLILSKAAYRTIRGLRERTATSQFINELPQDRIELIDRTGLSSSSPFGGGGLGSGRGMGGGRTNPYPSISGAGEERTVQGKRFKTGMSVRHPTFGLGRILELSGSAQQTRCVIDFAQVGRKTLILEYTRLETV